MNPRFISSADLSKFLERLKTDFEVLLPLKKGERRFMRPFDTAKPPVDGVWTIGEVRPVEPLKAFLFTARERVAQGFEDSLPPAGKPVCVAGVKACDLMGLKILDSVFLDDSVDPHYARKRRETLIVSSDCTCAIETCFCTAMRGKPYPTEGFDLNVSEVSGGYVLEAGSERGGRLLDQRSDLISTATPGHLAERDGRRERVTAEVRANVESLGMPDLDRLEGAVRLGYESPIWKEEGNRCVECGACNTVCPTCHCFLLSDQASAGTTARFRHWDSCLIKDFARVAGGANPRPHLWMRLRNRFEKKFDFFPKTSALYACTGCGRCVSACPARIDIRKVLKGLAEHESQRQPV